MAVELQGPSFRTSTTTTRTSKPRIFSDRLKPLCRQVTIGARTPFPTIIPSRLPHKANTPTSPSQLHPPPHPPPRPSKGPNHLYHFRHRPQYRALSYEWGSPSDLSSCPITVKSLPFPRHIHKNLESALVEIRTEKEDVTPWIDALCINQHNLTEKAHQVSMMGNVFREAQSVIVYLGPAADNSEVGMDLIADAETLRAKTENRQLSDSELSALIPTAYRSYWNRVWIMQEFFLAKRLEVRCGSTIADYDGAFQKNLELMSLPKSQFRDEEWKRGPNSPPAHTHMFARMVPGAVMEASSIMHNMHLFSRWMRSCRGIWRGSCISRIRT